MAQALFIPHSRERLSIRPPGGAIASDRQGFLSTLQVDPLPIAGVPWKAYDFQMSKKCSRSSRADGLIAESDRRNNGERDEKHQNNDLRYQEGRLGLRRSHRSQRRYLLEALHD